METMELDRIEDKNIGNSTTEDATKPASDEDKENEEGDPIEDLISHLDTLERLGKESYRKLRTSGQSRYGNPSMKFWNS